MFRTIITVLAVLFAVRLLSQFVHAIIVGMRGEPAPGPRKAGPRARRAAVDRAKVIDVDYTEVEQERAAAGEGPKKG